ncbi:ent-copalyl diphosphate synthase [Pyrus ussuriensis x Pyrus communis]|uniref:Ent-copalyl diphosphate synthase n=1 Tax=Pyrus ussuriensis x Pyrus communis TaxID=2448454 RepID=A0A5N5FQC4_9ROSA|nr:ent-copalyl diphosphate synthase [Pyrus ussuriensis x Pyrus communis]
MSSHSTQLFLSALPLTLRPTTSSFSAFNQPKYLSGVWLFGANDKRDFRSKCSAVSKSRTQEYADVLQNGLPVIKWHEIVEDDIEGDEAPEDFGQINKIKQHVETIKSMVESMDDGEITISAYDTAWVALVEDVESSGLPQFPSSLQWIANNQLPDGSWGDSEIFTAHDRIINTIACVVALKSWNVHPDKCEKGMTYFKKNISKLGNENAEHMPIGFEVAFPSVLEMARSLNLDVPDDCPVLHEIYAMRDLKLTRIPREIMHKVPTTLLHSLEGMAGLDWEKLLKLQSHDGSFLFSPASTAYALMQTKNPNCMNYLSKAVRKFNGGVPNVYPVDLFEHVWVVDRLQRLGISRYFEPQLKECINYVSRYWTEKGICWARNSEVQDIDDTAMAFRLLRLHGHQVSPDVFKHFKKGNEFICFVGQSTQAVTGMYNLLRASQVMFPGETILEEAKDFSTKFLREKQASNELLDKWIITKDLPGEVGYALDVPWYASLPRLETRFYIQQYGGRDDVWIGKTLYRMPYVNNNLYLDLAKLDYNNCQALHLIEWDNIQKWYAECKLENYGLSTRSLLMAYFVAASSIFEPERANERLAWAKTTSLTETIGSHFREGTSQQRKAFVHEFKTRKMNTNKKGQGLIEMLLTTLHCLSLDAMVAHGQDISHPLCQAWEKWLLKWQEKGDVHQDEAELLVEMINQTAGLLPSDGLLLSSPEHEQLLKITNTVCNKLRCYQNQNHKVNENGSYIKTTQEIEPEMQQLAQIVLQKPLNGAIESSIKQTFFTVARSFYYSACSDPGTINGHLTKVLFERVF